MLKTRLIHPDMLAALAASGHLSRVLIADGNFPVAARAPATARTVYLNLVAGIPRATDVLAAIVDTVPIEAARMMESPAEMGTSVVEAYRALLPAEVGITFCPRQAFYDEVTSPLTTLVVATGEIRRFANLLLTIGVHVPPEL